MADNEPAGIRRVLFQPKDGIFIEVLLGLSQEALDVASNAVDESAAIEELTTSLPGLREFLDEGVEVAEQIKEREGLEQCALRGRFGVPLLYKGIATHKGGLEFLEPNQSGLITAYLPEQQTFAVWFGEEKWFTFQDWTEEKFNEYFDTFVVMEEGD